MIVLEETAIETTSLLRYRITDSLSGIGLKYPVKFLYILENLASDKDCIMCLMTRRCSGEVERELSKEQFAEAIHILERFGSG